MTITDDVRKTLSDPTPLYAAAGTADLALEKLREVPALVERLRAEAPERLSAVRETDPRDVQERVSKQAKEAQAKVAERLGDLDTDIRKLRETAQDLALQSVGRAAEYAVKARETYDELAERGRGAVAEWRGDTADAVQVTTEIIRPGAEKAEQAEKKDAGAAAAATGGKAAGGDAAASAAKAAAKKAAPRRTAARGGTGRTGANGTAKKSAAKKTPKTDS
ncbi:hypothetical protein [Streptomyces synnematoformans]|uniref:Heparin-binding hemagglutinin n=1 Tax=Streptomyces synnematoformans TaxID=415721 RepID=A0ABN2XIU3_9ACTN